MNTLFEKITVVFEDGSYKNDMYVSYENGVFTYVGNTAPEGSYDRKINGCGKLMFPGLYNCHTHTPMTHFRGMAEDLPLDRWLNEAIFPAEDKLCDESASVGALLSCAEMIASGTVSMSDMYFFCPAIAEAIGSSKMKANVSRSVVSFDENSDVLSDPRIAESVYLFENYNNSFDGRIKVDMSLHAEYSNTEHTCEYMAKLAQKYNCGFHIHLSETKKEHEEGKARRKMTPCRFFEKTGVLNSRTLAAHCVWLEDEDINILARHGASVAHNPISNLKLGSGVMMLEKMLNANVNVVLGTDGAASNNRLAVLNEMNMTALLHRGVMHKADFPTVSSIIPMATVNGAKAQGRENCGCIKEGNKADFAIADVTKAHNIPSFSPVNTLIYTVYPTDVVMTVCDGETLYENGEFKTIDIEKLSTDMKKFKF